eukprot:g64237.t1
MSQENANPDEISKESASKKQKVGHDDEQEEPDWLATSQQVHVLTTQMECVAEVVQTYLQEVAKQVDLSLRPFVVDTIRQALENTVNKAAEDAVKRYNDEELQVKKERLVAEEVAKRMEEKCSSPKARCWMVILCSKRRARRPSLRAAGTPHRPHRTKYQVASILAFKYII